MRYLFVCFPKNYVYLVPLLAVFSLSCADQEFLVEKLHVNDGAITDTTNSVPLENPSETNPLSETNPPPETDATEICSTHGGLAGDTGAKVWCWGDIALPEYSGSKGVSFSDKQLTIDSECYERQVTREGDRLRFRIDPVNPGAGGWCERDYNMRAEIRTSPWDVRHAPGTEEWFGWSYTFGDDYEIDRNSQWLFFQVHPGVVGESPHTELMVIRDGQFNGHGAGEVYVVNSANGHEYRPTGIVPRAGETLDIVVHAVWGDASNGLLQVWIDGQLLYDRQVATVYGAYPWGGNAKWGIYKWPWKDGEDVQKSLQQGITHIETYMGPLRMITRRPGDPDYGKDSYTMVAP